MLRDDVQPISVDDHVIEPAHVFADHIEPKFRDRAPRIVERDGDQGWLWEDRFYPLLFQGNAATRKFRRGRSRPRRRPLRPAIRRHDPRRVRRARARPRDGRRRRVGGAAVPDVPALRRHAVPPGRRQGPRARDGAGVERLDARRVVRGVSRAVHPADAHPVVGRAGRRRRDRTVRRQGLARGAVHREPAPARAAVVPDRALASGVRGVQRDRDAAVDAHRHVDGSPQPVARDDTVGRHRAVRRQLDERARRPDLQRHAQRLAELQGRACRKAAQVGCRTCSNGSTTRGNGAGTRDWRTPVRPSELFAQHFWVCIISDTYAIRNRDLIGIDKLMWEADFPHNDSNWPNSRKMLADSMVGVPDDEAQRIAERNARELYRFPRS